MKDNLIKMAHDAGLVAANAEEADIEGSIFEFLQRFADLIRADQREKDAALCATFGEEGGYCAAAIRSAKTMTKGILLWLHHLFWKTLCPYPDQTRIGMWWYHHSGNIARFFYRRAHGIKD